MLTAMLAARNIVAARIGVGPSYDLWRVNVDEEYHEVGEVGMEDELKKMESTQPMIPQPIRQ